MPTCDYCGESFDDEQAYLRHLADAHEGELGAIDRRRVAEELDDDGSGLPTGPLVLGFVLLISALIVVYVIFFVGGNGGAGTAPASSNVDAGAASLDDIGQTPGPVNSAHEHGTMEVVVDGQEVDFSQRQYQVAADKFHFEGGNGRVWHAHATGVTLEWAASTLGIGVSEDAVVFDGTVYRDSDPGMNVSVQVNGEPVDPRTYVLEGASDANPDQGDHVRIVVETNETS